MSNDFNDIKEFLDESYKDSFANIKPKINSVFPTKNTYRLITEATKNDDTYYGIPELKKYPMNDKEHVLLAIKFFNSYADTKYEKELADRINDRIVFFKIDDSEIHITDRNKFKKYYKPYNEAVRYDNIATYTVDNKYINPSFIEFDYDDSNLGFLDNSGVLKEANDGKLHPIYMILSYTYTDFGKIVKLFTHAKYSHASLSFDSEFHHLYSFDGAANGFVTEDIKNFTRNSDKAYMLVKAFYVSANGFKLIKDYVDNLKKNKDKTKYAIKHCLDTIFNIKDKNANEYSQICSEFVSSIFRIIGQDLINKNPNAISPQDIANLKNPKIVDYYQGKIKDYNSSKSRRMFKKSGLTALDESFEINKRFDIEPYQSLEKTLKLHDYSGYRELILNTNDVEDLNTIKNDLLLGIKMIEGIRSKIDENDTSNKFVKEHITRTDCNLTIEFIKSQLVCVNSKIYNIPNL